MSIGPFQSLLSSHEMTIANVLPNEPWLLPISDRAAPLLEEGEDLDSAVRRAARPFWLAANTLGVALGLMLSVQFATGWMSPASRDAGPVAAVSGPPTIGAQTASFVAHAE